MLWLNVVLVLYALALEAGGVFGFLQAKSLPSLIMSSIASTVILAMVIISGKKPSLAYTICLAIAVTLAAFFGYRVANGSVMPGIPALAMSLIVIACIAVAHQMVKQKRRERQSQ
ncbi:MAG: TMEM14 family protein [Armatimonadetes bacterium]|nr:hypothetical protein [Armatimonadota bacterium]NOG93616.1 TMEM14 family protein [Armatimonadota bacterium]